MVASLSLFRGYMYRAVVTQHHDPIQRVLGTAVATMPAGSGLGLNFSMAMVELFGGSITLTSPGLQQGTTVHVRLPLAPDCTTREQTA